MQLKSFHLRFIGCMRCHINLCSNRRIQFGDHITNCDARRVNAFYRKGFSRILVTIHRCYFSIVDNKNPTVKQYCKLCSVHTETMVDLI